MTAICENDTYDGVDILKKFCSIFVQIVRSRYLESDENEQMLSLKIPENDMIWFIDDLEYNINILFTTNSQKKLVLRKTLIDTFLFLNKYI